MSRYLAKFLFQENHGKSHIPHAITVSGAPFATAVSATCAPYVYGWVRIAANPPKGIVRNCPLLYSKENWQLWGWDLAPAIIGKCPRLRA
jgi:hypothetical protein